MNQALGQPQVKKKSAPVNTENFLEALKSIGGGVAKGVTQDVLGGTVSDAWNTILRGQPVRASGDLQPNQSLEMAKFQQEKAQQQVYVEHRRLQQVRVKEEMIFSAREEQVKNEIQKIQEELKKLAADMQSVAREVQVAALQQTAEPGAYHINFFNHLKKLIHALRLKLQESRSWLATANTRSAQKKGYWGQFQKQGTSFSMNNERSLATSAG